MIVNITKHIIRIWFCEYFAILDFAEVVVYFREQCNVVSYITCIPGKLSSLDQLITLSPYTWCLPAPAATTCILSVVNQILILWVFSKLLWKTEPQVPPDWSAMSDNPSMGRETPTHDKDNRDEETYKLWAPHKFVQCRQSPCEHCDSCTELSSSIKMLSVGTYQVNDTFSNGYQGLVQGNISPISSVSNSPAPPPYPAMENLGNQHAVADVYNQFMGFEPQLRSFEDNVSRHFLF